MIDKHTATDLGAGVNFYSRQKTAYVRNYPSQQFHSIPPEKVGQSVQPESVQTGIATEHLQQVPGCRIPVENGLYVLPKAAKYVHRIILPHLKISIMGTLHLALSIENCA